MTQQLHTWVHIKEKLNNNQKTPKAKNTNLTHAHNDSIIYNRQNMKARKCH